MTSLLSRAFQGDTSFQFQNNTYPTYAQSLSLDSKAESIGTDFRGLVEGAYKSNGVVFACMLARQSLFSEARFQFRRMVSGRPGDLFGTADLAILEVPWPNGTTGDLLARMEQDASLAGNCFIARIGDRLKRLRPDWVTIVLGSPNDPNVTALDPESEVLGYIYHPGGIGGGRTGIPYLVDEVAHYAPVPDPMAEYRGMSWLTPVVREISADHAATDHKAAFFSNGATPQLVVSFDKAVPQQAVTAFASRMDAAHAGSANAYKTLYLGGGADVTVAGRDLAQLDFKATQGAGETRIAAAAGMHPAVLGLSEGLQGASLNAGNFTAARRLTGDKTLRPLWRNAAASLAPLIAVPAGAELWYDDRDIPFLREDQKDLSEIQFSKAQTIRELINSGCEPGSVIAAVEADDFNLLKHSGLISVQLQDPTAKPPEPAAPAMPTAMPPEKPMMAMPHPAAGRSQALEERRAPQNITVNPPEVNVTVEPPNITVNPPDVNVTVEPSTITVNPPEVNVTVPPRAAVTRSIERDEEGEIVRIVEVESDD